ncbi:UNVERIFIED_CONTAM: hypothetical protein K2H54_077596 [Gekko kuhli]
MAAAFSMEPHPCRASPSAPALWPLWNTADGAGLHPCAARREAALSDSGQEGQGINLRERKKERKKDKNRKLRPLYDIPYMFEAREFLRKKLIGKKFAWLAREGEGG